MATHKLTHKEEVKGGKDSHHHPKMAKKAHKHHESKKEAHKHEHMGMEKHERGTVKHHAVKAKVAHKKK